MSDTIYALSSGALPAGIAVVRVSGSAAFATLDALTPHRPLPRTASLRTLRGADGIIDRALVIGFPAPASATGEDIVEYHLHGGVAVVAALFDALDQNGARLAKAGEFTRRAYDNGRLDLSQVEGLADLIVAETEGQRRAAVAQAGGALRRAVDGWRGRLIAMLAEVEAELDFSDSDEIVDVHADRQAALHDLIALIDQALSHSNAARALRDGLTIVVAGPPNVGKSSLVNALAKVDVSIVAPTAGTTRDVIEVRLDLGGVLVTLVDTAGLRDIDDSVEREGIARANARIASADLVLWLYDTGEPPAGVLAVRTKSDLGGVLGAEHAVSSVTGDGIAGLLTWLGTWAATAARPREPGLLSQQRHVAACLVARRELAEAVDQHDTVLQAENLRLALRALGSITGVVGVEDILDALFTRFCIGK